MAAFEVRDGDKVWRVGRPDGTCRKAMVAAVAQLAWAEVAELGTYVPAAFAEGKESYHAAVRAGEHKPGGEMWNRWTGGANADALYLYGLLKPLHPEASLPDAQTLLARQPDACAAAITAGMPDFFDSLAADGETPPQHRPRFREAAAKMRALVAPTPSSSSPTTPAST